MDEDLNIRPATVKLLEENTVSMLYDMDFSIILGDLSPQARATKTKANKWYYIKLKSFCTVEKTINKSKMQPTE